MFIENVGQWEGLGRFQVPGSDRTIWLAEDGIWVTVVGEPAASTSPSGVEQGASVPSPVGGREAVTKSFSRQGVTVKLSFVGANPHPALEPFGRMETSVNYFVGNDPGRWRTDVPVWGGVRYRDLYPGLDLEVSSEDGQWKWRLVCRGGDCGKKLESVGLRVEGAEVEEVGAEGMQLATGVGMFKVPLLEVEGVEELPGLQWRGDVVVAPFVSEVLGQEVSRDERSASGPLFYATFLGGSDRDEGYSIAIDGSGSAYVVGSTLSSNFPTMPGAYDRTHNGGYDAFVVKLNASGSGLVYSTFLGGSRDDWGNSIAVDGSGAAYVTGYTGSSDFPTTPGAFDRTYNVWGDAFVVKLNASGFGLVYSTFLGGSYVDWGLGIAVDGSGAAYVTGGTDSSSFPTTPEAFDRTYNGVTDAFVVKLNPAGQGNADLLYATFLGGSTKDDGWGIAVDGSGAAYVTGWTASFDFPTTPGAYDRTYNGDRDAFVVKLNASGSGLVYATFLGGIFEEEGWGIAVDGSGAAYVIGVTWSFDFPTTPGAFDRTHNGWSDVFVVKLDASGSGVYSTFLGGRGSDEGWGIAIDGSGAAYVTGWTVSPDFPTTPGAYDTTCGIDGNCNYPDVFVVKLNASGSGLAYATFLGGSDWEVGRDIAVDGSGSAYVTGYTRSSNFPTTPGAFDTTYNGGDRDVFVVKLAASALGSDSGLFYATFLGGSDDDEGRGIVVDGSRAAYVVGRTASSDFPTTPGAYERTHNGRDAFVVKLNALGLGLVYATFLGGSGDDEGRGIAVDGDGAAYVTGWTRSSDFPTTPGAYDTSYNGGDQDVFVVKLDASGSGLDYATFLGGSGSDVGNGIVVDGDGAAYITGVTNSSDFPTMPGAYDRTHNGGMDAFVVKLNASGSCPFYATFLGGSNFDWSWDIAVDGSRAAYVVGVTESSDFPATPWAYERTHNGRDAFVVKLNASGSGLDYATFLGGSGSDMGNGIVVDGDGAAYVTGWTASSDFPTTPKAYDTTHNGGTDAFIVKLNASGSGLDYATFLGGGGDDNGIGIVVDGDGAAYVTGWTASSDFPTTPKAYDTTHNGGTDAFIVKLNASGSGLDYATFLGGGGDDNGIGIVVDRDGAAYVVGRTASSNFPATPGAYDTTHNGGGDAFVVKFLMPLLAVDLTVVDPNGDGGVGLGRDGDGRADLNEVAAITVMGNASNVVAPPGITISLLDPTADYGSIASATSESCSATNDCYMFSGTRSDFSHADVTFDEMLTTMRRGCSTSGQALGMWR